MIPLCHVKVKYFCCKTAHVFAYGLTNSMPFCVMPSNYVTVFSKASSFTFIPKVNEHYLSNCNLISLNVCQEIILKDSSSSGRSRDVCLEENTRLTFLNGFTVGRKGRISLSPVCSTLDFKPIRLIEGSVRQ